MKRSEVETDTEKFVYCFYNYQMFANLTHNKLDE